MDEVKTPSKIDLRYAEEYVIFTICACSLNERFSFYRLDRTQATNFLKRLKHIEQLTWKQWASLTHDKGLTPERDGSKSFEMINIQNESSDKLVEKYYFHFRVELTGLFRVFGYQKERFFCITHIDRKGEIHH